MDELIWVLFVIGVIIAAIVWVVTMFLFLLLYSFLFSSAVVGHPLILLLLVAGLAVLGRIASFPASGSAQSELFGQTMSVRSWAQIVTTIFLLVIGVYGVIVL